MWWNRWAGWARAARRGGKRVPERRRRPAVETLEDRLTPATLTVNSLADVASSDPQNLTLRDAVNMVNSAGNFVAPGIPPSAFQSGQAVGKFGVNDTIVFDTTIAGGTIGLSNSSVGAGGIGTLFLLKDVIIDAPPPPAAGKPGGITITKAAGGGNFSLISVPGGVTASLNGADANDTLTLTGGTAPKLSNGGAILNGGNLTLTLATVTNNSAPIDGGAIYNQGASAVLTIKNSTVTGNTAGHNGGAIENEGTVFFNNSTTAPLPNGSPNSSPLFGGFIFDAPGSALHVLNNAVLTLNTSQDGGAVFNQGTVTIDRSTITGNRAMQIGGGIVNDSGGTLAVTGGTTISQNTATTAGGGIDNQGMTALLGTNTTPGIVSVDNSDLSGNIAPTGGGIENLGTLTVTNKSVFSGNNVSLNTALNGGGIDNSGATAALTVKNSTFTGNFGLNGGAVFNGGGAVAAVSGSTINQNTASQAGGGIANSGSTLTVVGTTFDHNASAAGNGGGLDNSGSATATVVTSTFSNNGSGAAGGALSNDSATAALFLSSSTVSGNQAFQTGGGLNVLDGTTALFNVTDTNNRAHVSGPSAHGGGLFVAAAASVAINDTVVALNFNGPSGGNNLADDVSGALSTASSHNIVGDGTRMSGISNGDSNGNQVGVTGSDPNPIDPLLGTLAVYSVANLQTNPPLPGSPAIDAGAHVALTTLSAIAPATSTVLQVLDARPFIAGMVIIVGDTGGGAERATIKSVDVASETLTLTGPLTDSHLQGGGLFLGTDQVGTDLLAPPGNQVDVGAFESHGFSVALVSGSPQQQAINTPFQNPIVVSVTANNPLEPVTGGAVKFTAIPSAGAFATFSPNPATIDAAGNASGFATADGFAGTYSVKATAAGAVTLSLTLTNTQGLSLSPLSLPNWTLRQPGYNQQLFASSGQPPDTFSITGGTLPSGLRLSSNGSTGAVTGTPIRPGTFNFTITVTDSLGASRSQNYSITVNPVITITTGALPQGTVGVPYSQPNLFTATGGTGNLTFSVSGLTDPGLTFNPATDTLSGTPTAPETLTLTLTATDTVGATNPTPAQVTLVINPVPSLTTTGSLPDGLTHLPYVQSLGATGGTGALTFGVSGSLPPGLAINPTTGAIAGTPTTAGTFNFTVTATDSLGAVSAPQSFTIVVHQLGSPGFQLASGLAGLAAPNVVIGTRSVTLSGTVTSPVLVPTGTVTIHVGGAQLTAAVRADGSFSATLPAGTLLPGRYPITYTYSGDQFFLGSSGSTSLSVGYDAVLVEHRTPGGGKHTRVATVTVVLKDATGANVSSPGIALTAVGLAPLAFPGVEVPVVPASRANRGGRFRFKRKAAHGGGYVMSLKTGQLFPGAYALMFTAGTNPTAQPVTFVVM